MLDEAGRTQGNLRSQVSPKYRYDEREADLSRCLELDGYRVTGNGLEQIEPTMEPYFGKLTATATREAAALFMATWYRRTYGRGQRRLVAVCRVTVPANYAATLVGLRFRLGLSQEQFAGKVGAASKAVIYQWESGKRKPAPMFWLRIERLQRQLTISLPGESRAVRGVTVRRMF